MSRAIAAAVMAAALAVGAVAEPAMADEEPPPAPLCVPGSLPITGIVTTQKVVTFTFDDGPSRKFTPKVMKAFRDRGLHATFFMLGFTVKHKPELPRQMVADGDEVANHSYTHHYSWRWNVPEVAKANDAIEAATGVRPLFFRNPGLNWNTRILAELAKQGMCAIDDNLHTADWKMPRAGAGSLCRRFKSKLKPGSLVILHDGGVDHQPTADAVPCMLDYAIAQGYQVLGLREFLGLAGGDPAKLTYRKLTDKTKSGG